MSEITIARNTVPNVAAFDLNSIGAGTRGEGSVNACNVKIASVSGGAPISGAQSQPLNMDCTLLLPDNPLTPEAPSSPLVSMSVVSEKAFVTGSQVYVPRS